LLGDFDLAEEAAQDTFALAAEPWPTHGEPWNPGAWLVKTARDHAVDTPVAAEDEMDEIVFPDERLKLIFTCCHPALSSEAQVALTLRMLGGLSTAEIAQALLVNEEAMERRLSRAKLKIRAAGIPFAVPADHELPERLATVLAVVQAIFTEGHGGRVDLAAEAIRLGRLLATLMPDEAEVHGLLALMLRHDARERGPGRGRIALTRYPA
jgi:RNA polymerase sigma-70 factor (ECF subfamily)